MAARPTETMQNARSYHALHRRPGPAGVSHARNHCKPYARANLSVQTANTSSTSTALLLQQQQQLNHARFTSEIIDVAVRVLRDIWLTRQISTVFTAHVPAPARLSQVSGPLVPPVPSIPSPPIQLPSPPTSPKDGQSAGDAFNTNHDDPATNATALRGFVIDVLCRSHTSISVLQTALCYLEALRAKTPELVALEAASPMPRSEADQFGRIVLAADIGYAEELCSDSPLMFFTQMREMPVTTLEPRQPGPPGKTPRTNPAILPLAPPLPTPLLDTRRMFIAALVLASKFTQDRSYSNRAWAKLAGLPPREIGRCERALGNALDWRLWVGKQPRTLGHTAMELDMEIISKSVYSTSMADGRVHGLRRSSGCKAVSGLSRI